MPSQGIKWNYSNHLSGLLIKCSRVSLRSSASILKKAGQNPLWISISANLPSGITRKTKYFKKSVWKNWSVTKVVGTWKGPRSQIAGWREKTAWHSLSHFCWRHSKLGSAGWEELQAISQAWKQNLNFWACQQREVLSRTPGFQLRPLKSKW